MEKKLASSSLLVRNIRFSKAILCNSGCLTNTGNKKVKQCKSRFQMMSRLGLHYLTLSTMGKNFSRRHFEIVFLSVLSICRLLNLPTACKVLLLITEILCTFWGGGSESSSDWTPRNQTLYFVRTSLCQQQRESRFFFVCGGCPSQGYIFLWCVLKTLLSYSTMFTLNIRTPQLLTTLILKFEQVQFSTPTLQDKWQTV